jgi:hypothetical protein
MAQEEAEALASKVRYEIARTPALRDEIAEVKVLQAPSAGNTPATYQISVLELVWHLLEFEEHIPTPTIASRVEWEQLKARLVARWSPRG